MLSTTKLNVAVSRSEEEKVVIIGSGNFGSAMSTVIAPNVRELTMWVFEETLSNGEKLSDMVNKFRENPRYLPGVTLPSNLLAQPDLASACADATLLVFCLPHQFLPSVLPTIRASAHKNAHAISLIKGVDFEEEVGNGGLSLISETISRGLGGMSCSVLSGANVASEIARGEFAEATIGCVDLTKSSYLKSIFSTPTFSVSVIADVASVEVCGALKNVVALGCGFVDGLELGGNSKAAIIRIGLGEMRKFAREFFPKTARSDTLFESAGIADLITTCYGGRNRRCGEEVSELFWLSIFTGCAVKYDMI